jgi:4-hydroxybenzoate polyprenyltransferase
LKDSSSDITDQKLSLLARITGFYLYGSFHIGIGAMAMTWMTLHNLELTFDAELPYLLAILFGTIGFYSFHRIYDLSDLKKKSNPGKHLIISTLLRPIRTVVFTASVSAFLLFLFIPLNAKLVIGVAALFTTWYSLPLGRSRKKLREYPHVKIFIIALVWGIVTSGLPGYLSGLGLKELLLITAERSIFIFALTLPFDVRDYLIDHQSYIKTLPIWMGKKWSLRLSVLLLVVIQSILLWMIYRLGILEPGNTILMISTNLMVAIFVGFSSKAKNDYYFTGILDGMLILQPLTVYLFSL